MKLLLKWRRTSWGLPLWRLLTSESGLLGQGTRFVMVGGLCAVVYLLTTTLLSAVAGVPFQAALASGFLLALVVHFTLQRTFVWASSDRYTLPVRHQLSRYLLIAGAQYGVTAASTSLLPGALGLPVEVVYVVTVMLTASTNFIVFRYGVFHARVPAAVSDSPAAATAPVLKAA
jgi:putative flippase GtrA